jgi:hypothetical protein
VLVKQGSEIRDQPSALRPVRPIISGSTRVAVPRFLTTDN